MNIVARAQIMSRVSFVRRHCRLFHQHCLVDIVSPMEPDVGLSNDWVHRRFFLSTIPSAPGLFCCNTCDGFTIGQLNLDVSLIQRSLSLEPRDSLER